MDVRVVLVVPEGLSGSEEREQRTTFSSVLLAGNLEPIVATEKALSCAVGGDSDYSHLLTLRTIILPAFYLAMVSACEHANTDYVFCHCGVLGKEPKVLTAPTPGDFVSGQLLVKSWVLRELGVAGSIEQTLGRVLSEYRGIEVPHVLCMETGL